MELTLWGEPDNKDSVINKLREHGITGKDPPKRLLAAAGGGSGGAGPSKSTVTSVSDSCVCLHLMYVSSLL